MEFIFLIPSWLWAKSKAKLLAQIIGIKSCTDFVAIELDEMLTIALCQAVDGMQAL